MPGLLQYKDDIASGSITAPHSPRNSDNPEDADVWLPSQIATPHCSHVCQEGLAEVEEQICMAQCHDALDIIHQAL